MGRRSREGIRRPKERRRAAPKHRKVAAAVADLRERLDGRSAILDRKIVHVPDVLEDRLQLPKLKLPRLPTARYNC